MSTLYNDYNMSYDGEKRLRKLVDNYDYKSLKKCVIKHSFRIIASASII